MSATHEPAVWTTRDGWPGWLLPDGRFLPLIAGGAGVEEGNDEPAAAAQSADEAASTDTSPPPWGDDFNPERAWQTITHLRGREKELESDAKQYKRLREDEEAQREFLGELGYELPDEDDDESVLAAEPAADPRVDVLASQLAEIRFERDLNRFLGDRNLSEKGRDVVTALCEKAGNTADALKQAIDTWFALPDDFKPADPPTSKPAAHVLKGGKAATDVKDYSQMSRDEINRHMTERARALEQQT